MKSNGLQCTDCLPVKDLNGHPEYKGILVHSRVDVPEGMVYAIDESKFRIEESK